MIGHSSKLIYDEQAYEDKLAESVSPLGYTLNPYHTTNCNACLSVFGPRAGLMGEGVSTIIPTGSTRRIAPVNDVVDIESILTNRNLKLSKTKMGQVNDIDVTKFKLTHSDICNDFLNPLSTKLTYPSYELRSASINRFYDLHKNPQEAIFYNFAIDTRLEAKDNFVIQPPKIQKVDLAQPGEYVGKELNEFKSRSNKYNNKIKTNNYGLNDNDSKVLNGTAFTHSSRDKCNINNNFCN